MSVLHPSSIPVDPYPRILNPPVRGAFYVRLVLENRIVQRSLGLFEFAARSRTAVFISERYNCGHVGVFIWSCILIRGVHGPAKQAPCCGCCGMAIFPQLQVVPSVVVGNTEVPY